MASIRAVVRLKVSKEPMTVDAQLQVYIRALLPYTRALLPYTRALLPYTRALFWCRLLCLPRSLQGVGRVRKGHTGGDGLVLLRCR